MLKKYYERALEAEITGQINQPELLLGGGGETTMGTALVQTGTLTALVQTGTLTALIQTGTG